MKFLTVISFVIAAVSASPVQNASSKIVPLKDIGSRIINGEDASLGQFPWQVGLYLTLPTGGTAFCGGSILSEEWILTAGHCVYEDPVLTQVVAGRVDLNTDNGVVAISTSYILHDNFDINILTNDIGLIRLDTPLQFNDNISPISLSSDALGSNVEITVSGWGKTSDATNTISSQLHYIQLRTISNQQCANNYGDIINDGMVCAVAGSTAGQSPCNGDSGGPVVTNAGSTPNLVAVVSFVSGQGCESGIPSGYTRVSVHRDWIKQQTGV